MNLSKILSISGKSGLYKLISQSKNSFIVEALETQQRFPVFAQDGIATLDNISIFTDDKDVSLSLVLQNIYKKENGESVNISLNDAKELKSFFAEVLPEYDRERVYTSNIKKVITWYNLLLKYNLVDLDSDTEEQTENDNENKA